MQTPIARKVRVGPSFSGLWRKSAEGYDGGAPSTGFGGRIAEIRHKSGPREYGAHYFALRADAAAVNNAKGFQAGRVGLEQIFLDDCFDIAGRRAVQIENAGDGNPDWFGIGMRIH